MGRARSIPPAAAETASSGLVAFVAALGAALVPLFPDARLARLKLEAVELSTLALLGAVALAAFLARRLPRPPKALSLAVLAWLGVTALLSRLSADRALAAAELGRVATAVAAFFAAALAGLDDRGTNRFIAAWTGAAALVSLYAVVQRLGGVGPVMVPRIDRPIGTYGNPIFLAAFLVPSLFLGASAWISSGGAGRAAYAAALAVETVALGLTQTRSAYLALAGALVAATTLSPAGRRFRASAVVLLLLAFAAVAAVGGRDQAHALIWRDTVKLWRTAPLPGIGLGAFHVRFPDVAGEDLKAKWPKGRFIVNDAHNEYLQTLAEGGPLALAALLAVVAALAFALRRAGTPADLLLGAAALAGFVQNLGSADFRFGVSQAGCLFLAGLVAARVSRDTPPFSLGTAGRVAAAAALVLAVALAASRVHWYAGQRAAATAPGFFDERVVDPQRAISDLENRAGTETPEALEQLAFVYAKEMRRPDGTLDAAMADKAVASFRRVIAVAPGRAAAHNNLANVLFTRGDAAAADPEWRRAADLDPAYVDPRLNLGKTAYVRGDLKEAARWFQAVLKIDPSNAEAALFLRRMTE